MNRPHIETLTSLRFFAALIVVLFHHGQTQFSTAPGWLQNVVKGGYVGVPFFFVLSGFILALNYAPAAQAGTLDARRFWIARFARIYPVYAVSLLICAPLFLTALVAGSSPDGWLPQAGLHALASFGLLQAWIPGWAFSWNGPAWSLSVEAFFYLTFPFWMTRLNRGGRWRLLAGLALAGGLALVVGRLFPTWNLITATQQKLGWANPLLWLPLFLIGICLGEAHLHRSDQAARRRIPPAWLGAMSVAMAGVLVAVMAINLQRFSQLFFCYAAALPCAGFITLLAVDGNPLNRLFSPKPLLLLGEASYSLYILHRPIHDWFAWMETRWGLSSTETPTGFWLYLAACLALSVLSLKLVEYPCREWIKRRAGRPRAAVPATELAEPLKVSMVR